MPRPSARRMAVACSLAIVLLAAAVVPLSAEEDVRLDGGSWTKKSSPIAGSWSLVQRGTERFVVLDDAFKTKNAPDLKLLLSPLPLAEITGDNATDGALFLGALPSNQGRQEFKLPARVDIGRFKTVIVHCERYAKVWGGAALKPTSP